MCSSLPPVVCRRTDVLFVRLYLQLFVGGLMYCLVVFTLSCLLEGLCIVCSSLVPVVCWRAHVFTFIVPCCDVRSDFCIKTTFGSSLPPVVCRRAHVLFMLFVFVCAYIVVSNIS